MAHGRGNALFVVPLLALTLVLAGCPKRPATTVGSAPAPGVATITPPAPSGPSTTPPSTETPSTPPSAAVTPPSTPTPSTPTPAPAPSAATPATPPRPSEFAENANLKDIHFDFDKYDIRPGDARILDANAAWLKQNAGNLVLIEGHCDERGTAEYNLALGERRAKSTMNYLVSQGVAANRITVISYGKERPLCTDHNEACWAQNRRGHHLVKAQ